ncbi:TIR domain-containing protein [bacterium]|nr:TIR domain-containing protein [bacterium]
MNTEVFISYASKDRERILDLVDRLDAAGVSVWIDQMSIEGATMWSQEIVAAIRNCKVLILAISENSGDSENVVKEVALASEGRKRILPVYLESTEIPESMAYQLAGIQRVEFFEGNEEAGQQSVIRALAKLGVKVSEEASTAAAPKRTSHGASHAVTGQVPKSEGAVWGKIAAAVGGVAVLAAGIFFLGGGGSKTTAPLGQAGTNATNTTKQVQPLAKPVTLDTNRVVVLPFKVIGASKESEDLGYGLVSTLTSKLQPLQNLVVIANESAWNYEGSKLSPKEIGQALEVGTIVTGEIQTSGEKVQVNIRVIDANTAALGWGSTFTKTKDEFLDLQNEIATQLASELKGGLDASEAQQLAKKATENAEAQAEYQAGRREWNRRNKEGFDKAIKHFERAIELDPNYADPYVGLADTYGLFPNYHFGLPDEVMPKAKGYAQKAIDLNPNTGGAYTSLAWVLHSYEFNWELAEKNYRKAIELNPNHPNGLHWYGMFLVHMGKTDEGIPFLIKGTQLDPNAMIIRNGLSIAYICAGQKESALKTVNTEFQFDPYFVPGLHVKYAWLQADQSEKAVAHLNEAIKAYPDQPMIRWTLFNMHWAMGDRELAKDQLIELHARFHDSFSKARFAEMYYLLGKEEIAFEWLERGIKAKEGAIFFTGIIPSMKEFQQQPRFRELFKKINHPMYVDK